MPNELLETWELYRQNLTLHVPGTPLPRCPICLRPMHRPGDRNPMQGTVPPSRGHVAPKATGEDERHVVIECSECNSRSGLRFDAFYSDQVMNDRARCRKVEVETFARYLNNRRHPYFVNGIPARVEAMVREGQISATMRIDGEFDHDMRAGKIELQLRNPPTVRVVVSVLHSAYLRLFWHLGYEYVLHPGVQGLRGQLAAALGDSPLTDRQLVPFRKYFSCILRKERPSEGWSGLTVLTRPVGTAELSGIRSWNRDQDVRHNDARIRRSIQA